MRLLLLPLLFVSGLALAAPPPAPQADDATEPDTSDFEAFMDDVLAAPDEAPATDAEVRAAELLVHSRYAQPVQVTAEVLDQAPPLPANDPVYTSVDRVTCVLVEKRTPTMRPISLSRTLERVAGVNISNGFPVYRGVPMQLYVDGTWVPHRTAPRLAASTPKMPRGNIHHR